MEERRKVVLTKLAHEHINSLFESTAEEAGEHEAQILIDDFLDVVFGEIPLFPERFPVCQGIKSGSLDYRIANLYSDYRVIYQIFKTKILVLMILHEDDLPF